MKRDTAVMNRDRSRRKGVESDFARFFLFSFFRLSTGDLTIMWPHNQDEIKKRCQYGSSSFIKIVPAILHERRVVEKSQH